VEHAEVEGVAHRATGTEDEADACGTFSVTDGDSLRITNLQPVRERVFERLSKA
jgi:hypothetical protein